MEYIDILGLVCFLMIIYSYGLKKGIIVFIIVMIIGIFMGLLTTGYFFGDIGKYIFLTIIISISIIVYVKKFREYFLQKIKHILSNYKNK